MATASVPTVALAGAAELLGLLRDGRPRSRAAIGAQTGWARATIDSRLDTLRTARLIAPITAESTGGRPSSMFQVDANGWLIVAADIGHTYRHIAITDLLGTVVAEEYAQLPIEEGAQVVLDWTLDTVTRLLAELRRESRELAAIGMGLPSPVEHGTGRPYNPVGMKGWTDFDVPGYLRRTLDVPVVVDNDVNLMALGEHARAFADEDDLLFIAVTTGIGAGIIAGGSLQRGGWGMAGDIGHVPIARAADLPCECGNRGCIGKIASLPAIAETIRAAGVTVTEDRDVPGLVADGNLQALRAVRQAGRDIGELLLQPVALLNPSLIVVGGPWGQSIEHLIAGIREVVYARALPLATEHLSILAARTGDKACISGASASAVDVVMTSAGVARALAASATERSVA